MDKVTFNIPDLPDDSKRKPGRPSKGGPRETQRRKRAKHPEQTKNIGNAQKLRKSANAIRNGALNDLTTIGKTTAATLRSEFIRRKSDFTAFNLDIDFHQYVSLLTADVQKKLNRMSDSKFLSIDEIYFERQQHHVLIEELFPEFLVDGEFVPAKFCSMTIQSNFYLWSTKHYVKAYEGMKHLVALLFSLT